MSDFRLFPEERHWWTFADYRCLLAVCRELRPRRALEFGPGGSTLAMVEAGVPTIDACEDDQVYLDRAHELLDAHPSVRLHSYVHAPPLSIPALDGERFDLGFVDGPRVSALRPLAIAYALARCDEVYVHDVDSIEQVSAYRIERRGRLGRIIR